MDLFTDLNLNPVEIYGSVCDSLSTGFSLGWLGMPMWAGVPVFTIVGILDAVTRKDSPPRVR